MPSTSKIPSGKVPSGKAASASKRGPAAAFASAGRAVRLALGLLLIAMVLLNVANALSRYLLGQAIAGSDELLVFGMVWLVFLGAAFVTADRRHLCFDVVSLGLPRRARGLLRIASDLLVILLLGFVAWQSLDVVERLAALGQRSMAAALPTYIPHSAILVGFALSVLVLIVPLAGAAVAALRGAGNGRERPGRWGGR